MRTSKADRNHLSISQFGAAIDAGTPQIRTIVIPEDDAQIMPPDPLNYDSILKLSGASISLRAINVGQGLENSIDCNNESHNCEITGHFGVGSRGFRGDQVITVKGGCQHMRLAGVLWSRGRKASVVVGAWADQSLKTSGDLDFSGLSHSDYGAVTFVFGRVNSWWSAALGKPKDIQLPPGAKVLFWRSLGEICYWWAKRAAVKLGVFK